MRTCASEELYCLVLDDNGYVVVSDLAGDTGRFFGEIRPDVMGQLVAEGIYKPNRMYDYQATCFQPRDTGNVGAKYPGVSCGFRSAELLTCRPFSFGKTSRGFSVGCWVWFSLLVVRWRTISKVVTITPTSMNPEG